MAELALKYGGRSFPCRIEGARLLTAETPTPHAPPTELVRRALDVPLGAPPLEEIVQPGEKVVIVTSDISYNFV